jgi:DNA-binding NarL/FixJ family response regulator
MLTNTIKLALVDDHILFRKTLVHYLSQQESIDVILEASDAPDLFNKLKNKVVEILLVDIFMPKVSGTDALTMIRNEYPDIKIIVLSMCTDISLVNTLLDVGIHGYISKADEPEELVKAIRSASDDRIYRNKLFTEALYFGTQKNIKVNTREVKVNFDDREKKIIQLLWEEKNNREIADQLFLSVRSIEKIRQDIKEKLGVKTTVGLLKYALNKKIIDLTGSSLLLNLK